MNDYLSTFDKGYSRDLAAHYDAPLYMLAPNGDLRAYETPKQIRRTVKKWKRHLLHNGFKRSDWVTLNVKPLGAGTALVSAVFDRFHDSGRLLQRGAATYTVHKKDGDWKIFLIHIHDPDDVVTFDCLAQARHWTIHFRTPRLSWVNKSVMFTAVLCLAITLTKNSADDFLYALPGWGANLGSTNATS